MLNTGENLPVTGNINDKISVCLKIEKEGQSVVLRGNSEWSGISLELSILIYTVAPENIKKLMVGIRNWNYIFTISPQDFVIYRSGNSFHLQGSRLNIKTISGRSFQHQHLLIPG